MPLKGTNFGTNTPYRVIAPSILHLHYLGIEFSSADPSLDGVLATVCAQIEICYAIIATTTPCLRPFMGALSTHYGGTKEVTTSPGGTKATARSNQDSYSLGSLSTTTRMAKTAEEKKNKTAVSKNRALSPPPAPQVRWDNTEYNVNVMSEDQRSLQSGESRQMIISKNTEWIVDYEEQQGPGKAV